MHRIKKIGRVLLLVALMLPMAGCVIRTREYGYYPRDGYNRDYRDYDGPRYRTYSYYYYYRR